MSVSGASYTCPCSIAWNTPSPWDFGIMTRKFSLLALLFLHQQVFCILIHFVANSVFWWKRNIFQRSGLKVMCQVLTCVSLVMVRLNKSRLVTFIQWVLVPDFLNAHQVVSKCWFYSDMVLWFQDFEIIFLHTARAVFLSYDNATFFMGTEMWYKYMYRRQRVQSLQGWHLRNVHK